MKGAGVTMGTILGWPYWVGIAVVGSVITFNVALGGMKGITIVQAFQYWAKAFAIAAPVFILFAVFGGYDKNLGQIASAPKDAPKFARETTIKYPGKDKAPANAAALSTLGPTEIQFPKGAILEKFGPVRKPEPGEDPMPQGNSEAGYTNQKFGPLWLTSPEGGAARISNEIGAGYTLTAEPYIVTKAGAPVEKDGKPVKTAPKLEFAKPTEAVFAADDYIPNAQNNQKWIEPFGTLTGKYNLPLLYTYSLIIALVCGTAGLPHILVRFYTNPDGRAAKRTTFWVMILLGLFYVFTPVWGTLGRAVMPQLLANSKTDTVVIALPMMLENKLLGQILSGITSAGAFAAFMSTFSGLLVSMSGAFAHDIYGKILKPTATPEERLKAFQVAAVVVGVVAMGLGLLVETFDIALLVGWAFAIAAASYFPLLLLGSWWRGLTAPGAASGMLIGGTLSLGAIIVYMLITSKVLTLDVPPLVLGLMEQPAIWGVPLSLAIMVGVSLATKDQIPRDIDLKMLRLHAPEEMGYSKNYIEH